MTRAERLLAVRLLNQMSEHYGNHGCNDTDDELLAGITESEQGQLAASVNRWNSDDPEERMEFWQIPDYVWMAYLSDVLAKSEAIHEGI